MKSVIIENFQSISQTKLKLVAGLNVIWGRNGLGKSSILRALRWVCRDAYRGTWFIQNIPQIQSRCRVGVQLDDDTMVIRQVERSADEQGKTKKLKVNRYTVKRRGQEDEDYDNFKELPREVTEALDISPLIVMGKSADEVIDINFAHQQTDAVFLMNKPKSLSARLLSRIIGFDVVHDAMRELSRLQRVDHAEVKRLELRRGELEQEIEAFPEKELNLTFSALESKAVAVRELGEHYNAVDQLGETLKTIARDGKEASASHKESQRLLDDLPWSEAEAAQQKVMDGEVVYKEYLAATVVLSREQERLEHCEKAFGAVDTLLQSWGDQVPLLQLWCDAFNEEAVASDELEGAKSQLVEVETEYLEVLNELGLCPTCGAEEEHWHLEAI